MNFKPLHDRIAVKPLTTEQQTTGGIIIPDTATEKPMEGLVVAVGNGTHDQNNNKVFFDLAVAGNTYTLKGKAPFEILFGFAKGVSLTYNGESVSFESYTKNGIARFSLPE